MSGSPISNAQSDINQFVLTELRGLRQDMNDKFDALSAKIDARPSDKAKSFDLKSTGIASAIALVITTVIQTLKPT